MKKQIITIIITTALAQGVSLAQDAKKELLQMPAPAPRPWSIGVDGSFSHFGTTYNGGGGSDAVQVQGGLTLGRFVTDHIEIGFNLNAGAAGDNTTSSFAWKQGNIDYLAQIKYYFMPYSNFTPYVGIQGGGETTIGANSEISPDIGGLAGMQYYLTEKHNVSTFIEYNFLYIPHADYEDYHNILKVGLKFHFGK